MYKMNIVEEKSRILSNIDSSGSRDLVKRERVNFVVNSSIMGQLRSISKRDDVPMSRIIDSALLAFLNDIPTNRQSNPLNESKDVFLHHLLEIVIHEEMESQICAEYLNMIKQYFRNYISTNCILNLDSPRNTIIGTKIFLFLSDQDNNQFVKLINDLSCSNNRGKIEMRLDNENINLDI